MQDNREYIQHVMREKNNYNNPFYATKQTLAPVLIDQDHFPYKRYFRGVYYEDKPVIFEREAGWRPLDNNCYKQINIVDPKKHNFCWQNACSTILPCKAKPEGPYERRCDGKHDNYIVQP